MCLLPYLSCRLKPRNIFSNQFLSEYKYKNKFHNLSFVDTGFKNGFSTVIKSQIVYTDGSCRMFDKQNRFGGIGVFWGKNDPR